MKKMKKGFLIILFCICTILSVSCVTVEAASKPAKTAISSVKSTDEGKITVKWKKKKYKGYQVQIATNSKFTKNKKSYTVNGSSKTSKTISSLKKGKKYYVRVRTFKKSGKKKIYSSWCKAKSITVHKHSYKGKVTKPSTCTTFGTKTFTCSCGKKYTEKLSLVPHSLDANNVCTLCKETCTVYNFGKTKYVGPANSVKVYAVANVTNNNGKTMIYPTHYQDKWTFSSYNEYMDLHGCSNCALTTVLNAKVTSLQFHAPDQIISSVQKSVFGSSVFNKNYNKSMKKQMPVTLYGMTKIFDKYKVKYKYVYNYNKTAAIEEVKNHLAAGNPVLFTTKKLNGDKTWASSYHTMVMIGMDDNGNAIICDSSDRPWDGGDARIKTAAVEELFNYMWASKDKPSTVYWGSGGGKNGYLLVY